MSKSLLAEFHRDRFSTVQTSNEVLISHLDGARVRLPGPHSLERRVTRLLVERELLVLETGGTVITELGRWALAEILAEYADILLMAHLAAPKPTDPLPQAIETAAEMARIISTEMS